MPETEAKKADNDKDVYKPVVSNFNLIKSQIPEHFNELRQLFFCNTQYIEI